MDSNYNGSESSHTSVATENDVLTQNNKRQKLDQINETSNTATDFLNFDYEFPIDTNVINQQDNTTLNADFFSFVTDNEQPLNSINTSNNSASPPVQQVVLPQLSPSQTSAINVNSTIFALQNLQQQQQQQQQQLQQKLKAQQSSKRPLPQINPNTSDPPNQAVHTIVVGGKPFRLSWESLKSDGPSNFFLEYFRRKKTKVMHIDRDPEVFEIIVRHLRGYYIRSNDDIENKSLLFDATYYGLNRLKKMLQEYLFINVGGRIFRLPWDLFQKGNNGLIFKNSVRLTLYFCRRKT